MGFILLKEYFSSKNLKKQLIVFGVSILALIATMVCLGAFYFVNEAVTTGELGVASANLNTYVNPDGKSRFIYDMPFATEMQKGGNPYLGLGMILLAVFIFGYITAKHGWQNWREILKKGLNPYIVGVVLFFLIFSVSPVITLNENKLVTYPMLYPIERIWSIFRATDRFTWPILYIIISISIWWMITRFSIKKSILMLCAVLLIQWADIGPWYVNKGNIFKTRVTWQTELPSPAWNNLVNDYEHIFIAGNAPKMNSFLALAAKNKVTVNDTYLSRSNTIKVNENKKNELSFLMDNGPRDDTIYVFWDEEQAFMYRESGIHLFVIDGVHIGINSNKVYLDNYEYN
jgi:hypothetical protein